MKYKTTQKKISKFLIRSTSTLQFIGRFARTNASNIGSAKFIALNDEELEIENNVLYSKDSIWQEMIIGMSEGKNKEEIRSRNYYKEFSGENKSYLKHIPIHAIRPNCHVKIYTSFSFDIMGEFPDFCNVAGRILRNYSENTVVGIGLDYVSPLWMYNGDKINHEYILYIIHFQKETSMVHIYSQKHSETVYGELIAAFCESYEQIPRHEIYRVLGGLKDFEIFNSGMLSKQTESGESYRIMTGSDVSDAIDKDSGKLYSAGHAFCKAIEDSGAITIGYSSAAKVWSSSYKDLRDYINWCDNLGKKIANKNIEVKTNTNFDYLPHTAMLEQYPDNIFYADYEYKTYSSSPILKLNNGETIFRLTDATIKIVKTLRDKLKVEISIEEFSELLECDLNARYHSLGKMFSVRDGANYKDLEEFLTDHPLTFRTLDDTTIEGINVLHGNYEGDVFDNSIVEGINWASYGTDISLEFSKDLADGRISIQDTLFKILKANENYKYIIYDHGTGEIADYITIKESDTELIVELFHVKKKSGVQLNKSVNDIYEVSGQAIKSTTWFSTKGNKILFISNTF